MTRVSAFSALVPLGLAMATGAAAAQDETESLFRRDRNVSVMERPRPEYTTPPIQIGAFLFSPTLDLDARYNDNIFASEDNRRSDFVGVVNPRLSVGTTWSRHGLALDAGMLRREYADFPEESVWNFSLDGRGRIDIVRDTFVEIGASHAALTEARTTAGAANLAVRPVEYDQTGLSLDGEREFGRFRVRAGTGWRQFDYTDAVQSDGTPLDQDFRDRDVMLYSLRGDYAVSPGTAVFARLRANRNRYDLAPPLVEFNRDSSSYAADMGADFEIGGLARGAVGLGYAWQDHDDPALSGIEGVSADARVEWFPTQLTTVTALASREITESAIAESGGFIGSSAGVTVDHELLRNLILSAGVSVAKDRYSGIDREDRRWSATGSAIWLVNRHVGLRASYSYADQESTGIDGNQDYRRNIVGLGVVLRR